MLGQLRRHMVAGHQNIGKAFVIPQQHVKARLQLLDVISFKQKSFGLGLGCNKFHRRGFGDHPSDTARMAYATGII